MLPFEPRPMWSDGDTFEDHLGVEGAPPIARQHLAYFGGKGGGGTQTVTSKTSLPGWIEGAAEDNWDLAVETANKLKDPYKGPRVANLTPGQMTAIGQLGANVGSTDPAFNAAQSTVMGLQGFNPALVKPGSIAGADLAKYMNPFTKNVIDSSLKTLETQRKQAINAEGDKARAARAFGGSRQGVMEGVTNAKAADAAGSLAANLNSANFFNAQSMAGQDIATDLQGQLANQQADIQGAGMRLAAANAGGNLAAAGQDARLKAILSALSGQGLIQANDQAKLDADRALYDEQRRQPLEVLNIRQQALGMTPYGTTTTQTSPMPQGNGLMQSLGALSSMVGIAGGLFGPLGLFSSDEDEKTDIEKLGKDPATGLTLYAYRYKSDPKTYPKVVGPMAQEIEKKNPRAVREVGGKKVVNAGFFSGGGL